MEEKGVMSQISYGSITITDATDGVQSAIVYLYRNSDEGTDAAPSVPSNELIYTFSTGRLSGTLNGWQQNTVNLDTTRTIWLITAMALSSDTTDDIQSSEWSQPRPFSQTAGQDGQDGFNQATIFIYKRGTEAQTPTQRPNYDFEHPENFNPPNGWETSIPVANGNPCFVTAAVAIGRTTVVQVGEWATPTILAQDGVDGISPTVSKEGHIVTITDAAGNVVTVTDGASGTSYYTHIRYADSSTGANMSSSPTGKTYVGMYSGTSQTAPTTASSYTWSKYVGNQGVSVTAVKEVYYHTTGTAPAQSTLVNGTPIISTSTAGNVWTTVVPTYITGGKYYTSLQTSLSDGTSPVFSTIILNQGLTDSNYNAAVANSVASSANENALGAMSISRATQQHFWFNSTTSGTLEAGAYITDTPIDTFKNGKTGGYLLARSDGLELGRGTNKFMTLDSSALKFHNTNGAVTSTFGNSIALASNGASIVIGATGSDNSNISITSNELQLRRGTTANASLGSNGLTITNGAIQFGSGGASGTSAGNIRLANVDFNRSINNTNRTNLRLAIGDKFGVKNDGTLYASNATITGKITVSSGSDLSGGLGNYSTTQDMEDAISAATSELNNSIWSATNGYTILWNYENFATANNGEGYICKLDPATGTKSDANGTVMWNGTVRTITKQMINPNTIASYNIPIYVVCRLSSATATTGTNYIVWYNSEWKYATLPTPTAVGGTWTWAEATDIILGKFVESASEAALTECEIFDPPRSSKQVTTDTVTARSANSLANTANTTANTANTTANTANTTANTANTTANKALSQSAWYATCATAAATTAKVATITPTTTAFTLSAGATVNVKFSTTNSGAVGSITLNVNNTGAKNIKYINNNAISNIPAAGYIIANATYQFVYDGTYWVIQNLNYNSDTATTYITDIDSKKGITVKPSNSSGNDYLQMNSTDIRFVRNNVDVMNLTDSAFRMGTASGKHSTVDTNGLHIWTGAESTATNEVAFFGSTARIGVDGKQRLLVTANGINGYTYNSTDGAKAQLQISPTWNCFGDPSATRITMGWSSDPYVYMNAGGKAAFNVTAKADGSDTIMDLYANNIVRTKINSAGIHLYDANSKERILIDNSGMTVKNSSGTTIANFNSSITLASNGANVTVGQVATDKYNVYITNSGFSVRKNAAAIATFGSSITLGSDGATVTIGKTNTNGFYNTVINSSGLTINDNATPVAQFGTTTIIGNQNKAHLTLTSDSISMSDGVKDIFAVEQKTMYVRTERNYKGRQFTNSTDRHVDSWNTGATPSTWDSITITYRLNNTSKSKKITSISNGVIANDEIYVHFNYSNGTVTLTYGRGSSAASSAILKLDTAVLYYVTNEQLSQLMTGTYPDTTLSGALRVGGGTSNSNKRNIMLLEWGGNAKFRGDISAFCSASSSGGLSLTKTEENLEICVQNDSKGKVTIDSYRVGRMVVLRIHMELAGTTAAGQRINTISLSGKHLPKPLGNVAMSASYYGTHAIGLALNYNSSASRYELALHNASSTSFTPVSGYDLWGTLTYICEMDSLGNIEYVDD